MMILFWSKMAFVSHFFSELQKNFSAHFTADMYLDHILLGSQQLGELLACVRQANENAENLITTVQFFITIIL